MAEGISPLPPPLPVSAPSPPLMPELYMVALLVVESVEEAFVRILSVIQSKGISLGIILHALFCSIDRGMDT